MGLGVGGGILFQCDLFTSELNSFTVNEGVMEQHVYVCIYFYRFLSFLCTDIIWGKGLYCHSFGTRWQH